MRKVISRLCAALIVLVVLVSGHTDAFGQTPEALIKRLEARYDGLSGLRAEFTQTMSSSYSDLSESFSGSLLLQGERYRVETKRQTLVTDGAVTWIYNADENQVLINKNEKNDDDFSISHLFSDYSSRFNVTGVESENLAGRKHFVLHLEPRDSDSFFETLTVWMRSDDSIISRIRVVDQNETTMLFDLKNVDLDPTLDARSFTFSPPRNAEVIDLRS